MSPLLGISLAIIVLLWVIPLAWAVSTGLRSLPRLVGALIEFFQDASRRLSMSKEERQYLRRIVKVEEEYQNLQNDLVETRQLLAVTIEARKELLKKIKLLNNEVQRVEKMQSPTSVNMEKSAVARSQLPLLERELTDTEFKVASLRIKLSDLEAAVQKAHTRKQITIASEKAALATSNAYKLLERTGGSVDEKIRKLESKIIENEVSAYGETYVAKFQPNYSDFVESVGRLQIESLNSDELKELLQTINEVINEISSFIFEREANEELIAKQLASSEADFQLWKINARQAEADGKPILVKQAEVNQFDCQVQIAKHKHRIAESKAKTAELKLFEMKLSVRKGDILVRTAESVINELDFSPDD